MYFRDLSAYSYNLPRALSDVLTVGWLEGSQHYNRGKVDDETIAKLSTLIKSQRINPMRGYHFCEFCPSVTQLLSIERKQLLTEAVNRQNGLGDAEVWVPNEDRTVIYAAPNLVYHYITAHDYRPPQVFIDAVNAFSDKDWDPDREYDMRTRSLHEAHDR